MNTLQNKICHIDYTDINNMHSYLQDQWGQFVAYHIYNVPERDYEKYYIDLACSLGTVNDTIAFNGDTTVSKSRDIKFNPDLGYRYFAANTRQPLHTDYAYYEEKNAPDWLMLFCMDVSEFGGMTHLLTLDTLKYVLEQYNPSLLEKLNIDVNWKYSSPSGDIVHTRKIFDGNTINWNYYQIKEELNSEEVIKVRDEFFEFMETYVQAGRVFDLSKNWSKGDCIIFNDHLVLHARDAFLGNSRWLKDCCITD